MQKWEYWMIQTNDTGQLQTELLSAGEKGFELVTVIQPQEQGETKYPRFVAWMKRPGEWVRQE